MVPEGHHGSCRSVLSNTALADTVKVGLIADFTGAFAAWGPSSSTQSRLASHSWQVRQRARWEGARD